MNKILHSTYSWLPPVIILMIFALFFRFAVKGYSYIAHTLTFIAALIVLHFYLPKKFWRILVVLVCIGLIYFCIVELLIIGGSRSDRDEGKDYIIVLGAEVKGTVPSRSLLYRLNGAFEYMWLNPDSIAIVSGGKGDGEHITEAQCMYNWLTEKGIEPERIIMEDRATSTMENLEYSFDIIRERGEEPDGNVCILSSSYHLYRAKQMAKIQGVEAAGYACSPGNPLLALNFFIREAFGVTHLWVFGN
ncbi:MAG: YdcF family protein [Candidatus Limivicinus sp.]|jgi:uncharacterized SAM-binding protein YcdF (DUF218 family)